MLCQAKSFLCAILFSSHNNPMRYCDAHFPKRKPKLSQFSFPLWSYVAKNEARTPVELCPKSCGWANLPSKPHCGRMTAKAASPSPPTVLPIPPAHLFLLEPAWPRRVKLCSRCYWDPCPHPLPSSMHADLPLPEALCGYQLPFCQKYLGIKALQGAAVSLDADTWWVNTPASVPWAEVHSPQFLPIGLALGVHRVDSKFFITFSLPCP